MTIDADTGPDRATVRAEGLALRARFEAAGAEPYDAPVLLPAQTLLDLYGEDIRARAYVTTDPLHGEQMLRPDFTVPLVQDHMAIPRDEARYAYTGVVFRQQDVDPDRSPEYFQTGLEVFGGDAAAADAEVFTALAAVLDGLPVRPVTGDIGVLAAAVESLTASDRRKAALRRHLWRPARFRALVERFAGDAPVSPTRAALFSAMERGQDPMAEAGPEIGLRSSAEVRARLDRLAEDRSEPPLPSSQVALLDRILGLGGPLATIPGLLHDMAGDLAELATAANRIEARCDALAARGTDPAHLPFEASFGRTTLEYYDGFVFGFIADSLPDGPPVGQGGRYDALTRVLGNGREAPAVGGVIRPELVLRLRGMV